MRVIVFMMTVSLANACWFGLGCRNEELLELGSASDHGTHGQHVQSYFEHVSIKSTKDEKINTVVDYMSQVWTREPDVQTSVQWGAIMLTIQDIVEGAKEKNDRKTVKIWAPIMSEIERYDHSYTVTVLKNKMSNVDRNTYLHYLELLQDGLKDQINKMIMTQLMNSQDEIKDMARKTVDVANESLEINKAHYELGKYHYEVSKETNEVSKANYEVSKDTNEVSKVNYEVSKANYEVSKDTNEVSKVNYEVSKANYEVSKDTNEVSKANYEVSKDNYEVSKDNYEVSKNTNDNVRTIQEGIDWLKTNVMVLFALVVIFQKSSDIAWNVAGMIAKTILYTVPKTVLSFGWNTVRNLFRKKTCVAEKKIAIVEKELEPKKTSNIIWTPSKTRRGTMYSRYVMKIDTVNK
ncbi:hypothetical protein TetV_327 [Tetraselmis virus 1]|uniref:Uncharacterized protein n=1 Tax=Tetraselmis virus 1 TaxID=2060617 RepID=A0A2P0VNU0_9VIRU|nr:hypothetical protein QJ968_gp327 [Tetraselmis virus 1]AUF82419.1 hypothetical protein TetV_327 [Tetraselmis virus 1]